MPKRFVFNNEEFYWHEKFDKHEQKHFIVKGLKISHCHCGAWWIDDVPAEKSDEIEILQGIMLYKIIKNYINQVCDDRRDHETKQRTENNP